MTARVFVKRYATVERLAAAVRHHQWLTRYAPPLRLPALVDADPATGRCAWNTSQPFGRLPEPTLTKQHTTSDCSTPRSWPTSCPYD
jgi:hypothetical protein